MVVNYFILNKKNNSKKKKKELFVKLCINNFISLYKI